MDRHSLREAVTREQGRCLRVGSVAPTRGCHISITRSWNKATSMGRNIATTVDRNIGTTSMRTAASVSRGTSGTWSITTTRGSYSSRTACWSTNSCLRGKCRDLSENDREQLACHTIQTRILAEFWDGGSTITTY